MSHHKFLPFLLIAATTISGCATFNRTVGKEVEVKAPAPMVQANPIADPVQEPAVVTVYKPMAMPGQLKKIEEITSPEKAEDTESVIDSANLAARQQPDAQGYFNSMMAYVFDQGALYQVYCAPLRLTDIQLQPGEELLDSAIGDPTRWTVKKGMSKVDGADQVHVYVKPNLLREGLETTLFINTNRRSYAIELHSYKKTYMAQVSWQYPQDEVNRLEKAAASKEAESEMITDSQVNLSQLNFEYTVETEEGSTPIWTPIRVWDDGRKTFIQFPQEMLVREAPVLYVRNDQNDSQLVNYRQKNDYFLVDRLFEEAELRMGEQDQTVVVIRRKDKANNFRSLTPRAQRTGKL